MKVLVCGGRTFIDKHLVWDTLNEWNVENQFTHIIHGGARGADALAGCWAREYGIQEVRCEANWNRYGARAGFLRNAAMLALKPDLVVAFPGGVGTAMMTRIAREAGVRVEEIN
jgi:hypothetical protein